MDIHDVAELILKLQGTIFGGYVRDLISKETPRDIDVLCNTYEDFKGLLMTIIQVGVKVTIQQTDTSDGIRTQIYGEKCIVYFAEIEGVKVDFVVRKQAKFLPDANVNRMKMSVDGIELMNEESGTPPDVWLLIKDIRERVYRPEPGMSKVRMEKMRLLGYSIRPAKQ